MERPEVDKIDGLSPVIAIEQKTTSKSPRSTVGTITELYDFLRLMFARIGTAYSDQTNEKMVSYIMIKSSIYMKPITERRSCCLLTDQIPKGHYRELFETLLNKALCGCGLMALWSN